MKETQLYLVLTAGICHSVALSKRISTNFMLESVLTISNTGIKVQKKPLCLSLVYPSY